MARSSKWGRTETLTETVTAKEGRQGRNEDGNGGRGGRCKLGGQRGPGEKISPLVEDMSEYWESYNGDIAG